MLLQTKLFKPAPRPSLIARPQLIDRLNEGLGHGKEGFAARLTLVSAPAGFGKTTLAATWLAQLPTPGRHAPGATTAWLSLDEGDNDPVRFMTYLIAALQTALPDVGQAALQALQSPQPPTAETVSTLVLNEVGDNGTPLLLALDDYHVIHSVEVHQALAFLLEHLPPSLHLLLTTRSDPPLPLSRLRGRSQVTELRAVDLRFTLEEARAFLAETMGLALTEEESAALEQRTEGWVAGLQLAGLSLQGQAEPGAHIAAFSGSHHMVLDYLTEEVLGQQPPEVRQFLLYTSILERVCGPLADALTQSHGAQEILESLERGNLFLTSLDQERRWYRYHHLFAEVLRQRLLQAPEIDVRDLHRRAGEWLAKHGLTHEAVTHALAASDFEQAAQMIEEAHGVLWQHGEIRTLQRWLAALPAASWRTHPRLWLVQAWAEMTVGDFAAGDEKLRGAEEALALMDEEAARILRPEVLAFRASYASLVQDPQAIDLAQAALRILPADYWMHGMLVVFLAAAFYVAGDLSAAADVLAEAPGSPLLSLQGQPHGVHLLAFGGTVQQAQGNLQEARSLVRQALQLAEPGGKAIPFVGTLLAYMSASMVLYELGEVDEAEAILTRCNTQAAKFGSAEVQLFALSWLGRLCLARHDVAGAARYNGEVEVLRQSHAFSSSITAYVDYNRFLLFLKQNNLEAAAAWVASRSGQAGALNPYAFQRLALPQLLIAQGKFSAATERLGTLVEEARASGHGSLHVKALALQALAYWACGDRERALTSLEQALLLAEPEGFCRAFVDEGEPMAELLRRARYRGLMTADRLLGAFAAGERTPGAVQALPEPLSEREMDVLRLVATGASNKAIAAELYVALPTVKKHMGNILVKLDVANRVQAVSRAQELGLL